MITDDNFARNKNWEEILDRLIHLREVEKLDIKFSIQIDTGTHKSRTLSRNAAVLASSASLSDSRI